MSTEQKTTIISLTDEYLKKIGKPGSDALVDEIQLHLSKPPVDPDCPKEKKARELAQFMICAF